MINVGPARKQLAVFPTAINDSLTIAGWFVDAKGQHGFVREANGAITSFDVTGNATVTVTGMNSEGEIGGRFGRETGRAGTSRQSPRQVGEQLGGP